MPLTWGRIIRQLKKTFRNDAELLHLFYLAETLGKTVDELLLGRAVPISNVEMNYWAAYRVIKKELEDEVAEKSSKSSSSNEINIPRHMGMGQT